MFEVSEGSAPSVRSLVATLRDWSQPSLPRNVILNWTTTSVTILSTLIVTPIVVRALETELYGIWSFLNGLLVYADLLYLGLGAALVKYAAEHLTHRDPLALNRLCSVVFSIYLVLGLVSLGVAALVAPSIPRLFAHPLNDATAAAARYTCLLLGFRLLWLFVCSVFTGALVAADRTDVARLVTISFTLIRLALIPIVLMAPSPLVALALLVSISAACETVAAAWLAAHVIPGLRVRLVVPGLPELRPLYRFGLGSFLVLLAVKIISYTDTTLIGITIGAGGVALYALPLQLAEYGRVAINGIVAVLLPRVTSLALRGGVSALQSAYLSAARVSCAIAVVINVHMVVLGGPFLGRWVGPEFARASDSVLVWLACASVVQCLSTQLPLPFYQALNRLRVPVIVLAVEGVANVALSLALVGPLGLGGVALGTAVPAVCISGLILPRYMCAQLQIPLAVLVRTVLLPAIGVGVMDAGALWLLGLEFSDASYSDVVIRGATALIVVVPVLIRVCAAKVQPVAAHLHGSVEAAAGFAGVSRARGGEI